MSIRKKLAEIERKNNQFFKEQKLKISSCVKIIGRKTATIHVINSSLPFEIKDEIETLYWK